MAVVDVLLRWCRSALSKIQGSSPETSRVKENWTWPSYFTPIQWMNPRKKYLSEGQLLSFHCTIIRHHVKSHTSWKFTFLFIMKRYNLGNIQKSHLTNFKIHQNLFKYLLVYFITLCHAIYHWNSNLWLINHSSMWLEVLL